MASASLTMRVRLAPMWWSKPVWLVVACLYAVGLEHIGYRLIGFVVRKRLRLDREASS